MRYLATLLITICFLTACQQKAKGPNGVVYKTPVEYNDYIVSRQTTIMKNIVEFSKVSQTDLDSAGRLLVQYEEQTGKMLEELKGMPPFKGDSSLRDAGIGIFSFYKKVFANDYKEMIDIASEKDGITDEGRERINAIIADISREEEKKDKAFQKAQKAFVKDNNIRLVENSMQKEIDKLDN